MLEKYVNDYTAHWEKSAPSFPFINNRYELSEKSSREKILDQYLDSIKALRKRRLSGKKMDTAEEQSFFNNTQHILCHALDFNMQQLGLMFSDDIKEVTRQFVKQARQFDSELSFQDIYQGGRNVWIMNGLQVVLGLPVRLTPSIFAYSMLYPYTDNLIDDPQVSALDKLIFSHNFHKRLEGQSPVANSTAESHIYRLVGMIEEEFPREEYPGVYDSLIAIHDAQTKSLQLMNNGSGLTETDVLMICLEKGGASVVADGYLVAGKLTKAQEYFLFGYGAYLQLLDDIQDVEEDGNAGLKTVFSKDTASLEYKINKTYWFGEQVMQSLPLLGGDLTIFQSLMRKSMDLFIIEAIAQNPGYYSPEYTRRMEAHSPFGFEYIQRQKDQFAPYKGFLLTALEELAFSEYTPERQITFQS
ncbi:MAG TPA: hypothetical protein VK205_03000 [Prolixibacteraceae bacterium]|nr:hypothetical protein [Prolixibacteraceae bacterium]